MPKLRMTYLIIGLAAGTLVAGGALAANVHLNLIGKVTSVADSPFAPGCPEPAANCETEGVNVGDNVTGQLDFDNTTAQSHGGDVVSYELTSLQIVMPDTTQVGGTFTLTPAALNSATRIIFRGNGAFYHGMVLPNNVTGFDNLDGKFDLDDLSFEAEGFNAPEWPGFRFNLGVPVVELPEPGVLGMLAAGSALVTALARKRIRS